MLSVAMRGWLVLAILLLLPFTMPTEKCNVNFDKAIELLAATLTILGFVSIAMIVR